MLCHGNIFVLCFFCLTFVQGRFSFKRMADENENSAASGKFIFRLKAGRRGKLC